MAPAPRIRVQKYPVAANQGVEIFFLGDKASEAQEIILRQNRIARRGFPSARLLILSARPEKVIIVHRVIAGENFLLGENRRRRRIAFCGLPPTSAESNKRHELPLRDGTPTPWRSAKCPAWLFIHHHRADSQGFGGGPEPPAIVSAHRPGRMQNVQLQFLEKTRPRAPKYFSRTKDFRTRKPGHNVTNFRRIPADGSRRKPKSGFATSIAQQVRAAGQLPQSRTSAQNDRGTVLRPDDGKI